MIVYNDPNMGAQDIIYDWRFYFQLITLIIAVIGVILGVYNTWLKDRIAIQVKINYDTISSIETDTRPDILLIAENHSLNRTVFLASFGFHVEGISEVITFRHIHHGLPRELKARTNHTIPIPDYLLCDAILENRVLLGNRVLTDAQIIGFYRDQLNNKFKSKPFLFKMVRPRPKGGPQIIKA